MAYCQDLIDYANQYRIPITVINAKPYSLDANLFRNKYEGCVREDSWVDPPPRYVSNDHVPSRRILYTPDVKVAI